MKRKLSIKRAFLTALLASSALFALTRAAQAEPVRVGYWTSGVSLGFGAVLEAQQFLQKQGLDVQFVRFSDVNAPTRALAANAIDFAFAAPAAGVFSTAAEGVPVSIVLATQPADVEFVAPLDSPIKTLADLRGKKIGMSPAGSSVAAIASAVLQGNEGIKDGDFALVPGNDQLTELKVKNLGNFVSEWQKLTKSNAVPYIGVSAVRNDYLQKHPQDVAKLIAGLRAALQWGSAHHDEVAAIMEKSANLPAADAQAYAAHWDQTYRVTFEPIDLETLRREHQIFVDGGVIKGDLPSTLFATGPYQASKALH